MRIPRLLWRLIDRLAPAWVERSVLRKAIIFGCVGVINFLVDFSLFSFAYYGLGWPIIPANVASGAVAITNSYVLNSKITFAAESGRKLRLKSYFGFVAAQFAGFVGNTATVYLAAFVMPVWLGKLLAAGVSFLINFSLSHFFVFRRPGEIVSR